MTPALLGACGLVLLAGGLGHARHPAATRATVAAHGVLPRSGTTFVGTALPAVEIILGAALLIAIASGSDVVARWLGMVAAVLFAGFTAYLVRALQAGSGGMPCACGVGEAPLGPWTAIRAGLLALMAAVGAVAPLGVPPGQRPGAQIIVLCCAAVALAVGISVLPAARANLEVGVLRP
jgi:hypothetical protein